MEYGHMEYGYGIWSSIFSSGKRSDLIYLNMFSHSFNYLLSVYYVPGTDCELGTENAVVSSCSQGTNRLVGRQAIIKSSH